MYQKALKAIPIQDWKKLQNIEENILLMIKPMLQLPAPKERRKRLVFILIYARNYPFFH
jgi:hypothetical protein